MLRWALVAVALAGSMTAGPVQGTGQGAGEVLLDAFGPSPPPGAHVLISCAGFAPNTVTCEGTFPGTGAALFMSACGGAVYSCGPLTAKVRARVTDATTLPDERICRFAGGLRIDCEGTGDGRFAGETRLVVTVEAFTSLASAQPPVGRWWVWAATAG